MLENHISDQELLLHADGELNAARSAAVQDHLASCWSCRTRQSEFESAIEDFVRVHYRQLDPGIPPLEPSLQALRARLSADTAPAGLREPAWGIRVGAPALVLCAVAAFSLLVTFAWFVRTTPRERLQPNSAWTPGAVSTMSREVVCAMPGEQPRAIAASTAEAVFRRYRVAAKPRSYEVDYLIPPALGGSGDIRNLWPQPYSSGEWNSHVKDALEDHLRTLVCSGDLDLATAQRDISRDWIAAYKKYFRTDRPLVEHSQFVKDRPWE